MNVTVSDSVSANNATGVSALSTSGTPVNVMVRNSTIANNIGDGLASSGSAGAIIRVTRSTITGNGTAWANFNSSFVLSYGDNNIDGNTNGNIEPPGPLTYK
jgi:hypothetical protein